MSKKDKESNIQIYTSDGNVHNVVSTSEDDTRFYEELPFNSPNVTATKVTEE